jgi:hypothetical protein
MKMKNKYFMLVMLQLVLGILIVSCKKERISANGNQISEVRKPGNFTGIRTGGVTPVFITYGAEPKVEVKGSENLVAHYKTRLSGNDLVLEFEDNFQVGDDDISVFVTLPLFTKLNASGNAQITVGGNFPEQQDFTLDMSGSGGVKVVGNMKVVNAKAEVTGSGSASLQNLQATNAVLAITGSGTIRANVTTTLKGSITGNGTIHYTGNPTVDSSISGSGKIVRD